MAADWFARPVLSGRLVRLEPLAQTHTAGLLAAAGKGEVADEVFRWMLTGTPRTMEDMTRWVDAALLQGQRRQRVPFAQVDARTGAVAGTTSYYFLVPQFRALAIGFTWVGRRWWGTGLNLEAKGMLLQYAFETLGAVRVIWHTDALNVRSQRAVERLGAVREGVMRKHRPRPDGTWRDTVQFAMTDDDWPAAKARIVRQLREIAATAAPPAGTMPV